MSLYTLSQKNTLSGLNATEHHLNTTYTWYEGVHFQAQLQLNNLVRKQYINQIGSFFRVIINNIVCATCSVVASVGMKGILFQVSSNRVVV